MSKIDDYLQQKTKSIQALMDLTDIGFTFGIWRHHASRDDLCDIYIQMSRMNGECCHAVNDTNVAEYLLKSIAESKSYIIKQAISLAKTDMETARQAAEGEAREVLQILNPVIEN